MKFVYGAVMMAVLLLPGLGWAQAKDSQPHHENAQKPPQPKKTLADPAAHHSVDVGPMMKGDGGMKDLNRLERQQPHMRIAKPAKHPATAQAGGAGGMGTDQAAKPVDSKSANSKIDFTYRPPTQGARNPAVPAQNDRSSRKPH